MFIIIILGAYSNDHEDGQVQEDATDIFQQIADEIASTSTVHSKGINLFYMHEGLCFGMASFLHLSVCPSFLSFYEQYLMVLSPAVYTQMTSNLPQ